VLGIHLTLLPTVRINNPTGMRIRLSWLANTVKIEHDAPDARSDVLGVKTKLPGHLQHARLFGQDIAVDPLEGRTGSLERNQAPPAMAKVIGKNSSA
jgi:hypothetical protein